MNVENFYFDLLPLHPRPEKLESLSSYVMRLVKANSIKSFPQLMQTCFSDYSEALHHLDDFPIRPLRDFQAAANCSEAEIQAMTFYHLGEKFGRTFHPNACYLFLRNSIAYSLRYCPYCLKEHGYYSLLWRFRSLKGCSEHGCFLLDACWHCSASVPIFVCPSLDGVGICSSCKKNLGEGQSRPLQPTDLEETLSCSQDLIFLLSPLCRETMTISPEYHIGKQMTSLRQAKGLSVQEVAKQTKVFSHKIVGVEFTFPDTYTISFESYVEYAKFLGSSFRSIFAEALVKKYSREISPTCERQVPENEVLDRVQKAISVLIHRRKRMTKRGVFKMAQLLKVPVVPSPTLLQQLEHILSIGRAEQRRETASKNKILELEVREVVSSLEAVGKPVTYGSISDMMNFSYSSFEDDMWDIKAVNDIISHLLCHQQFLTDEEDIYVTKIEMAVDQLEEIGEPVVRRAILHIVGREEEYLYRHPRVKALLKDIPNSPL